MCGIAGRVNQWRPVEREELFRMMEPIAHRGPDDHGYHLRPRVALGHRPVLVVPDGNEGARVFEQVRRVASGEVLARAEENKHREFQFWAEQTVSL